MSSDVETEDDPVVEELNVFLSKQLSESLYLFQYPVRSVNLPYEGTEHTEVKMKPIQQKVHLEMAVDTRSPNYSRSHGEQISVNMRGSKGDSSVGHGVMDRQTLVSSTAGVKTCTYAVGAYRNGQMYVTPVKGIVELRPGLDYLDKANVGQKSGDGEEENEDENEGTVVIKQRIRANETEEAKAKRLASYEFLRQQQEDEEYVRMRYHYITQEFADERREKLSSVPHNPVSEFYMRDTEYGDKLMATKETEKATQANIFSLSDLKFLPIDDQISALMKRAVALHFNKIISLLPVGSSPAIVINYLQNSAVLIQGVWVVKSEVLYPKDWTDACSGLSAEKICRVRDYILWKFSQNQTVSRAELDLLGKIPKEDETEILCRIASYDKSKHSTDWIFAFEPDVGFIRDYPDVFDREERVWQGKSKKISDFLRNEDHSLSASVPRTRKNSGKRKISGSEIQLSDLSDTDAVDHQSKVQNAKVAVVKSKKRTQRVAFGDDVDDLINEVIAKERRTETDDDQFPVSNIKSEPSHDNEGTIPPEQKTALTEFLRKQLQEVAVVWLSMLRLRLRKHLAGLSPGHILGRGGISDPVIEQCLVEAGGHRMSSSTVNGEPVYLLPRRGDTRDALRSAILDLLDGKSSLKIGSLRKKLTDGNGDVPTDNELKKVLKEFCETRGGCWHLKGTIDSEH